MTDMAKVQELLKFTSADLPYNRRGERSPAQKKAWDEGVKGCARNFLQIFVAVVVLSGVGFALLSGDDRIGVLIVGGIFGLLSLGGYFLMRSPTEGIDDVKSITGAARLNVDRGENNTRHYVMMIDKIDFTVGAALYDVLEHGTTYTAHYHKLGRSHQLLSLEERREA